MARRRSSDFFGELSAWNGIVAYLGANAGYLASIIIVIVLTFVLVIFGKSFP